MASVNTGVAERMHFQVFVEQIFAEQTQRTQCFIRAFAAKKEALALHGMPADAEPTHEVMGTVASLFIKQFVLKALHPEIRNRMSTRADRRRCRNACAAYLFQAVGSKSEFWEAIRTNQLTELDRANIAHYEYEMGNAQRQRTVAITIRILKLGVCIATAWARSRSQRGVAT